MNISEAINHSEATDTTLTCFLAHPQDQNMLKGEHMRQSPDGQTNEVAATRSGNSHAVIKAQPSPCIITHAFDHD